MLVTIEWIALTLGFISSIIIAIDVIRHPQMMTIMNIVWIINGWFFGPFAVMNKKQGKKTALKDAIKADTLPLVAFEIDHVRLDGNRLFSPIPIHHNQPKPHSDS